MSKGVGDGTWYGGLPLGNPSWLRAGVRGRVAANEVCLERQREGRLQLLQRLGLCPKDSELNDFEVNNQIARAISYVPKGTERLR